MQERTGKTYIKQNKQLLNNSHNSYNNQAVTVI